jgi:hypothetical protein
MHVEGDAVKPHQSTAQHWVASVQEFDTSTSIYSDHWFPLSPAYLQAPPPAACQRPASPPHRVGGAVSAPLLALLLACQPAGTRAPGQRPHSLGPPGL